MTSETRGRADRSRCPDRRTSPCGAPWTFAAVETAPQAQRARAGRPRRSRKCDAAWSKIEVDERADAVARLVHYDQEGRHREAGAQHDETQPLQRTTTQEHQLADAVAVRSKDAD